MVPKLIHLFTARALSVQPPSKNPWVFQTSKVSKTHQDILSILELLLELFDAVVLMSHFLFQIMDLFLNVGLF